jgi:hypothetical protein
MNLRKKDAHSLMHIIRFRCQKDGTYYWLYLWMNKKLSVATVGALLC